MLGRKSDWFKFRANGKVISSVLIACACLCQKPAYAGDVSVQVEVQAGQFAVNEYWFDASNRIYYYYYYDSNLGIYFWFDQYGRHNCDPYFIPSDSLRQSDNYWHSDYWYSKYRRQQRIHEYRGNYPYENYREHDYRNFRER